MEKSPTPRGDTLADMLSTYRTMGGNSQQVTSEEYRAYQESLRRIEEATKPKAAAVAA